MTALDFEIYNVFAESAWGGNPLAIVPNADGLNDTQMQLIARQFNLSETVFLCASNQHAARLRIFTPSCELPFAGHPTIGAAAWLHQNLNLPDHFSIETPAKVVQIDYADGVYRFTLSGYSSQTCILSPADLASALGLNLDDLAPEARWMNAGAWQLLVPLTSADALARVKPNLNQLHDVSVESAHLNVYAWYKNNNQVHARYFFNLDKAAIEDPGTGGACANLGAWAHLNNLAPINWKITQAESINRPNHLYLNVNAAGEIQVGGRVMPFAQGQINHE